MKQVKCLAFFFVAFVASISGEKASKEEIEAMNLVQQINAQQMVQANKASEARWNYESGLYLFNC